MRKTDYRILTYQQCIRLPCYRQLVFITKGFLFCSKTGSGNNNYARKIVAVCDYLFDQKIHHAFSLPISVPQKHAGRELRPGLPKNWHIAHSGGSTLLGIHLRHHRLTNTAFKPLTDTRRIRNTGILAF